MNVREETERRQTLDALRLHTNPWSNNRGPVVMLHGGEAPCPCGNIDISIRWFVDCESPVSRRSSLSFGKSSTVINYLRTGSRSTQSLFRTRIATLARKISPLNFSHKLCTLTVSSTWCVTYLLSITYYIIYYYFLRIKSFSRTIELLRL